MRVQAPAARWTKTIAAAILGFLLNSASKAATIRITSKKKNRSAVRAEQVEQLHLNERK